MNQQAQITTIGGDSTGPTKKEIENLFDSKKPLSVVEAERLAKLEKVIADNLKAFYAVGCVLKEIRDSRLYREGYPSFEAYCKEVWDTGKRIAYYQIDAVGVYENVHNCAHIEGLPTPANEAQIRPLTRDSLSPEDQITCWKMACSKAAEAGRKVTAFYVEETVVEFLGGRAKRQLGEMKKRTNDIEFTMEFKRALTPIFQLLHNAAENHWKDTNRQKIIELLDQLRSFVAGK